MATALIGGGDNEENEDGTSFRGGVSRQDGARGKSPQLTVF